jgi:Flp pilus assembly protein TadD
VHDYAAAEAEFRKALRLKPDYAEAHNNLGRALGQQGKLIEAMAEYREAIRLKPDDARVHKNLGAMLCDELHDYPAAEAEFRAAIRLKPDDARVHYNLGLALVNQGKRDEAIAAYHETIRLQPDFSEAHYNLGNALKDQGKLDEAAAAYREAIRLKPDDAEAHCNLADLLRLQGKYSESLAEVRRGHELGTKRPGWPYPSAEWVHRAERLVELESRLPAVLRGDDQPKDAAERLEFAYFAYNTKQFGPAVRLFAESFRSDPKLADEIEAWNRYNAACAAALATAGKGDDKRPLDEPERARWRKQAIDWLKTDLAFWAKQADTGKPEAKALVGQRLQHWKADSDLAGIRDETTFKALPDDERKACRALWAEVDELLAKVQADTASGPHR